MYNCHNFPPLHLFNYREEKIVARTMYNTTSDERRAKSRCVRTSYDSPKDPQLQASILRMFHLCFVLINEALCPRPSVPWPVVLTRCDQQDMSGMLKLPLSHRSSRIASTRITEILCLNLSSRMYAIMPTKLSIPLFKWWLIMWFHPMSLTQ